MTDEVLTERRDRVLVITLNRPESMNTINTALAKRLLGAVTELDEDEQPAFGFQVG